MDFSQAQYEGGPPAAAQCGACNQPLAAQYWTAGKVTVCGSCAEQLRAGPGPGGGLWRAFKAFVFGCGAGLAGATGYGLIIHYGKVELAIVTIFIGWMVGRAVRFGSEGRGGRWYQFLGALLTYVWCMMAYVPDIVVEAVSAAEPLSTPFALIIAPFLAVIIPFSGAMGILGTLILAFGVWRGWREPARVQLIIEGPFALAQQPTALLAAAAAPLPPPPGQ